MSTSNHVIMIKAAVHVLHHVIKAVVHFCITMKLSPVCTLSVYSCLVLTLISSGA